MVYPFRRIPSITIRLLHEYLIMYVFCGHLHHCLIESSRFIRIIVLWLKPSFHSLLGSLPGVRMGQRWGSQKSLVSLSQGRLWNKPHKVLEFIARPWGDCHRIPKLVHYMIGYLGNIKLTLKIKNTLSGIPTWLHHHLSGLILYHCRHLVYSCSKG